MNENIITAYLHGRGTCTTAAVYQYDSGMILQISGVELPNAYTVDFSNSVTGSSISQVGGADGVTIPDQFFVPGSTIHAWVVLSGTGYAVTRYHIMIPISPRAVRTNDEPSPSQQSALDEAIAALNDGVERVEAAAEGIDQAIADTLTAAKESGEFDGPPGKDGKDGQDGKDGTDGYTPVKGVDYFDGQDGAPGQDGKDGQDGQPGRDGEDGEPGQDGVSPTITVTDITGGHRIIITDAEGEHAFDVMDGESGASPVQDVQVNGTSILDENGVANVPVGNNDRLGVFKTSNSNSGIMQSSGTLMIDPASTAEIKAEGQWRKPVTVGEAYSATFYGLARASGDRTQKSSSNAVGAYTESAKSAISQMLNAPVTVSGSTPAITALPGVRYICGEVATLDITLPESGIVDVTFESGSTATVLTITPPSGATLKWANGFDPSALEADTTYEINIADGLGVAGQWT